MPLNPSLSGVQAFTSRLDMQAHNIANINSEGHKKGRVLMEEERPGVRNTYDQVDTPGPLATNSDGDTVELSNAELAEELPQSMISQRGAEVNIAAIRVRDEMLGSLLDLKA